MSRTPRARLRAPNTRLLATARRAVSRAAPLGAAALILLTPAAAYADPSTVTVLAAPNDLPTVIANLQKWIMGILWSLAGLYAVIGALYRTTAAGDPEQVTKGNTAFKNAAIGAALGVLAPVLLQIVQGIVGG